MVILQKTIYCLTFFMFLFAVFATPVLGAWAVGEVLYHQDFADVSTASIAGIRKGTISSDNTVISVTEDALGIYSADDRRAYALLPEIDWTDSYTIEFSFRFTEALTAKGYLSCLLTCWGEEPSNITAAVFRVDGTIDDFGDPSAAMQKKIRDGETIHVTIPIEDGILHTITLTSGNLSCSVQRDSLKRIAEGERGVGIRNASVEITEVYVVNGTGYSAKNGEYADRSWADDRSADSGGVCPPTGEKQGILWICILSGCLTVWAKRRKCRG
ncbi:MAG: hypothetical protein IJX14_07450 [Clostridia bacterium]|nr:hypothetical protein [Clostridia bacterium]